MQKIVGRVRRAVEDYGMISEGDKIVVGLSGGKDSILLLTALAELKKYYPKRFDLAAVNIDMGFQETSEEEVKALSDYVESLGVTFYREKTDIAEILFRIRNEKNPCSLCSKLRRGALNTKCLELGANKLALGHHSDDVLETVLLSFVYEGRFSCFSPVTELSRTGITVIRPMLYVGECDVKGAAKRFKFPVVFNPCPADKHTKREEMKELVKHIQKGFPDAKDRMLAAIFHPERTNLRFDKKVDGKDFEQK